MAKISETLRPSRSPVRFANCFQADLGTDFIHSTAMVHVHEHGTWPKCKVRSFHGFARASSVCPGRGVLRWC